jgi:hypothetical protein
MTPTIAKRKVNGLLLDQVGTGLLAETPELVTVDGRLRWRFPVILSLPWAGRLGQVGVVDVDVQSGEVLADDALIDAITYHATQLVPNSAP